MQVALDRTPRRHDGWLKTGEQRGVTESEPRQQ